MKRLVFETVKTITKIFTFPRKSCPCWGEEEYLLIQFLVFLKDPRGISYSEGVLHDKFAELLLHPDNILSPTSLLHATYTFSVNRKSLRNLLLLYFNHHHPPSLAVLLSDSLISRSWQIIIIVIVVPRYYEKVLKKWNYYSTTHDHV